MISEYSKRCSVRGQPLGKVVGIVRSVPNAHGKGVRRVDRVQVLLAEEDLSLCGIWCRFLVLGGQWRDQQAAGNRRDQPDGFVSLGFVNRSFLRGYSFTRKRYFFAGGAYQIGDE
jgi:hypothetical protein